MIVFII